MTALTAAEQALYHFEHHSRYDDQQRVDAVQELADWGLFSNEQIARFTGMNAHKVAGFTGKTDRTGGNLTGESLVPIIALINANANNEVDRGNVRDAMELGASTRMIAKLAGMNQRTVARWGLSVAQWEDAA